MELRHLRYFTVLAGSLNFTRAAERLHVTQSTLSHQIKQLEDELGKRLFERSGKRIALSEEGAEFLHHATRALREIDNGLGALRHEAAQAEGELRVGTTTSFSLAFIPECVASFLQRHPQVRVIVEELAADQVNTRLQDGSLDVGVAYRPATPVPLHFEPLYNEEMVLVVGKAHPLARRKRVRMVELHGVGLALLPRTFATRTMLDECFRACGAQPHVAVEMSSPAAMMRLVTRAPLGSIVAANAVPLDAGLSVVRLESPTPVRTPGILWSQDAKDSAATRAFTAIVRKLAFRTSLLDQRLA